MLQTLRSLARGLLRSPAFTALAVLTLAVGIGATTAVFSLVNAILLRPLPFPDPERLVGVWHSAPGLDIEQFEHSLGTYVIYKRHARSLEGIGLYDAGSASLTDGASPERVTSAGATASLFTVLRATPARGRAFVKGDERPGAEPIVILSDALWRRRFGGDPAVVGKSLRVDGVARQVVGVMPPSFRFPEPDTELWLPVTIDEANLEIGNFNWYGIARLAPGATPETAQRELAAIVRRMPEEFSSDDITAGMMEHARFTTLVHPQRDDVVGEIQQVLWVLLGAVGVILLIACANVANLFLVRAEARQREVAVRTALGASRGAIARTFLGETTLLAVAGGLLGLLLAGAGLRALLTLGPEGIPRLEEVGIDLPVLGFTLLVSLLAALLCSGFAALRYGTPELVPALKEGGRGGSTGRERHRARNLLVVAQMALALVLLVCSGLMVRSFWRLRHVDPGLEPRGVLTVRLALPETEYPDEASNARFTTALLERVRALSGVVEAGTVTLLPLTGGGSNSAHTLEDFPLPPDAVPPIIAVRFATPEYFRTMGIPLLAGRTLSPVDPARPTNEIVVSAALAERFWPGKSALGRRIVQGLKQEGNEWSEIVGVVGSVRDEGLHEKPFEAIYYPLRRIQPVGEEDDWVPRNFTLVVKVEGEPMDAAAAVREAVWGLDRNLPLAQMRTMEEVLERSTARTSFTMLLLLVAAAMAVLLGAVGNYGVISYVVSQRTREIGVRMALGAARGDVAGLVLRQGLWMALGGVAIGLAGAFALTRLLRALLFEVSPTDPATFSAVSVVLVAVALLASYLPARRAASVDPLEAIRYE
ncbi:MAG TPA: ABC transporter permease [Thermoanaerobaculia bacterium]|nr:ABC transporter permease [Thermoanaerobaculia bacterium]